MKQRTLDIYNELFTRYPALNVQKDNVKNAFDLLLATFVNGKKALCCGNGGSASDSEHIVGELVKSFKLKRKIDDKTASILLENEIGEDIVNHLEGALPAISLVSSTAFISAFANDNSWDYAFAQQVYALGEKGDCLICLSTSGNSKNCVLATKVAHAKGITVLSLTGESGGLLKAESDVTIAVPERETFKVQELHLPVYHALCAMLESEFFE